LLPLDSEGDDFRDLVYRVEVGGVFIGEVGPLGVASFAHVTLPLLEDCGEDRFVHFIFASGHVVVSLVDFSVQVLVVRPQLVELLHEVIGHLLLPLIVVRPQPQVLRLPLLVSHVPSPLQLSLLSLHLPPLIPIPLEPPQLPDFPLLISRTGSQLPFVFFSILIIRKRQLPITILVVIGHFPLHNLLVPEDGCRYQLLGVVFLLFLLLLLEFPLYEFFLVHVVSFRQRLPLFLVQEHWLQKHLLFLLFWLFLGLLLHFLLTLLLQLVFHLRLVLLIPEQPVILTLLLLLLKQLLSQ